MFHIVLFEPEIPHNAGAAGRLAVATGSRLHLIKPLGFSLDAKQVRRAGLDYWKHVDLHVWENWEDFTASHAEKRMWFLTTRGETPHWEVPFREGDVLVFGAETRGFPDWLRAEIPSGQTLRIPMAAGPIRSLNLSTSIGIVLFEAMRGHRDGLS
ncbi:MAG: tRNA (cytidine(34)-2'-O)-methyltransferase [Verrucomicrobiota bacterium JB023]|nr:tRNA (cytidine(34)-2'-O)-methyltransferase [Verrucomicrobiota bacterium JB023]